jgi:hypothetical protein
MVAPDDTPRWQTANTCSHQYWDLGRCIKCMRTQDEIDKERQAPVAPDDTPTRLQRIAENLATDYYIGTFKHTDDIHFLLAEVSRLREALVNMESGDDLQRLRAEQAEAEVSRLQQENAALIDNREVMAARIRELEDELKNR